MLQVRFKDVKVTPDSIKICDSYSGILEGHPEYISRHLVSRERDRASREEGFFYIECDLCETPRFRDMKTIPPFRYSVDFVAYLDGRYYKLTIVFFDFDPTIGLSEFLSAKTENLEFKQIAKSMSLDDYVDNF